MRFAWTGRTGWHRPAMALVFVLGVGLAGPFNTFRMLDLPERLLYWSALILGGGLVWWGGFILTRRLPDLFRRWAWRVGVVSLIAYPLGSLQVLLLHRAFDLWLPPGGFWAGWLYFLAWYAGIGVLVVTPLVWLVKARRAARPADAATQGPPPLLKRLPPSLHGPVLALSAEDHYVRVYTDKGDTLVLMRFSDALAELGRVEGRRVHRSHWVAAEAVSGMKVAGRSMALILKNGRTVPVSRSYRREARALGRAQPAHAQR